MDGDEEDEENNDVLNVESPNFDPLSAIYSKKLIVPFPSAPVLDNLAKAASLLSRNQDLFSDPAPVKKEVKPSTSKYNVREVGESTTAIKDVEQSKKNVILRMSQAKGPLGMMRDWMEKRVRVKVWTRSARTIRGYCVGFVAAFDNHWNIALEDVHEVWSRPVKRKKYLLGERNEMPVSWKAMGPPVQPPKIVVTKVEGGKETCERHVSQMLVRGEQIVFVSALNT